jgi:hypothetical protein
MQAPLQRGVRCIQGLVNLVDVSPDTTGEPAGPVPLAATLYSGL